MRSAASEHLGEQNVFISWSGRLSRSIAEVFAEMLPIVLQAARPFFSPEDIEKGRSWFREVSRQLERCQVGLLFMTPDNLTAPWIMFEAGALAKNVDVGRISPILFNVTPTDLPGPLKEFQMTSFEKADILRLLRTINAAVSIPPVRDEVLKASLDGRWSELSGRIEAILKDAPPKDSSVDLSCAYDVVAKLLAQDQLIPAVEVGRMYLNTGRIDESVKVFEFISERWSQLHKDYYIILGNMAYALMRKGRYEEALANLDTVKRQRGAKQVFAWHSVARAYALYMLHGNSTEYKEELSYAKSRPAKEFADKLHEYRMLYPEIAHDLDGR